jgi:hypothetical protein
MAWLRDKFIVLLLQTGILTRRGKFHLLTRLRRGISACITNQHPKSSKTINYSGCRVRRWRDGGGGHFLRGGATAMLSGRSTNQQSNCVSGRDIFHPPTRPHFANNTTMNTGRHLLGTSSSCYAEPVAARSEARAFIARGFESRLRHGCLSSIFYVVLSCVGRGLATS